MLGVEYGEDNNQTSVENFLKVPLEKINIGYLSGEKEANDPKFEELFYTGNSKYEELLKEKKFIIKGRKGTGKTILAYYFKKKAKENNIEGCEIYNLSDINLQKIIHLEGREFYKEEYTVFWEYYIYLEMAKLILESKNTVMDVLNYKIIKLKKFVKEKYESRYEIEELIRSREGAVSKEDKKDKGILSSLIGLSAKINNQYKYKPVAYYKELDVLKRLVKDILKSNDKGFVIMFDNLDELGDDLEEHKNYRNMIIGIITCLQNINSEIMEINKKSRVILIIRSDILDCLNKHSSNIRKIVGDNSVDLYWVAKEYNNAEEHLLMDMVLTKIQSSVEEYKNIPKNVLYENLFPKDISGKNTISYLSDMSMGRPRQVVELLKCIINNYKTSTEFISSHFRDCLKYYSPELYKDLLNEFSVHENKNELNDCLNLIGDFRQPKINYIDLTTFYKQNKDRYPNIKEESFDECLNQLYSFGIIGEIKKEKNKHTKLSWGYRLDGDEKINFNERTQLLVHSGLKHKFNME